MTLDTPLAGPGEAYDPADDGYRSWALAIEKMREIHETAIAVGPQSPQGAAPVAPSIGAAHTRGDA